MAADSIVLYGEGTQHICFLNAMFEEFNYNNKNNYCVLSTFHALYISHFILTTTVRQVLVLPLFYR